MKAFKKLIVAAVACLLLITFVGENVYASSGKISLSDPTGKVGESIAVTVKVTATGSETIKSVDMKLTYDESALEFESGTSATGEKGTVQLSGTADSAIKTYTLNFKTLKESTSNIKISTYEVKDNKDTEMEISNVGSATVTVSSDGTKAAEATTTSQEGEATETKSEASKIVTPPKKDVEGEIAGTKFNICKITKDIIPEGFEYIGYMYDGVAVDALKKDNIILFYLNQVGETSYVFYVYDPQTDGFSIYAPINPVLDYMIVNLDEEVTIPEGFTETEISVGGVAVTAWQSTANAEYYLLYLMNSEGSKNMYLYDIVEKTVQRYTGIETETPEKQTDSYQTMYTELNDNYNKDMSAKMNIIYGFIIATVILIFVIINLIFRLHDKKHSLTDEEDAEDDDIEIFYQELETKEEEQAEKQDLNYSDRSQETQDNVKEDYADDYAEEYEEKVDKKSLRAMKKAERLEKKEKAKRQKVQESEKDQYEEEDQEIPNSEEDFDDSDDFEVQIFDLDDK